MTGKNILSLALAVIVGIVAVKLIFAIIGVVFTAIWWLAGAAVLGVVVYALYRGFNNMLTSGKRLT